MMRKNIILIGMKGCGKSTVGKLLARKLAIDFIELDNEIEKTHFLNKKKHLTFREIFKKHGGEYFRSLENNVLKNIVRKAENNKFVLACGGGTPLNVNNQILLRQLGKVIYLDVDKKVLLQRTLKDGIPAFFPYPDDPEKSLAKLLEKRRPIYKKAAQKIIRLTKEKPEEIVNQIINLM
jgi:shikimate kinase